MVVRDCNPEALLTALYVQQERQGVLVPSYISAKAVMS